MSSARPQSRSRFIPANPQGGSPLDEALTVRWLGLHFFFSFDLSYLKAVGKPVWPEPGRLAQKPLAVRTFMVQNGPAGSWASHRARASNRVVIGRYSRLLGSKQSASGRITRDSERAALRDNIRSREHLPGSHRPGDFSVVHLLHAAEPSGSACREDDQFPSRCPSTERFLRALPYSSPGRRAICQGRNES